MVRTLLKLKLERPNPFCRLTFIGGIVRTQLVCTKQTRFNEVSKDCSQRINKCVDKNWIKEKFTVLCPPPSLHFLILRITMYNSYLSHRIIDSFPQISSLNPVLLALRGQQNWY